MGTAANSLPYDQGRLEVPPGLLLELCRLEQHRTQPWPIFWSRHQRARLVSSSLALLDGKKRICREAVYGDDAILNKSQTFQIPDAIAEIVSFQMCRNSDGVLI